MTEPMDFDSGISLFSPSQIFTTAGLALLLALVCAIFFFVLNIYLQARTLRIVKKMAVSSLPLASSGPGAAADRNIPRQPAS